MRAQMTFRPQEIPLTQHLTFRGHGTQGFARPEQGDGAEAAPSADVMSSWLALVQACTQRDPSRRPTLDQVETALAEIYV